MFNFASGLKLFDLVLFDVNMQCKTLTIQQPRVRLLNYVL